MGQRRRCIICCAYTYSEEQICAMCNWLCPSLERHECTLCKTESVTLTSHEDLHGICPTCAHELRNAQYIESEFNVWATMTHEGRFEVMYAQHAREVGLE